MGRQIVGVVVGWLAWLATAVVAGVLLRWLWPEYVAASADMTFTLAMKLTRLSIGALATVAAGAVAARVGRSVRTAAVAGAILLGAFIPVHISLWDKFPHWYHLTFLVLLVPLAVLGGRLADRGGKTAASNFFFPRLARISRRDSSRGGRGAGECQARDARTTQS